MARKKTLPARQKPGSTRTTSSRPIRAISSLQSSAAGWPDRSAAEQTSQRLKKLFGIEGLAQGRIGADFGGDSQVVPRRNLAPARHGDDLHRRPLAAEFGDGLDAFLAGHEEIGDQHFRGLA